MITKWVVGGIDIIKRKNVFLEVIQRRDTAALENVYFETRRTMQL